MLQRALALLLAVGIALFCSARVSAQEILSVPSGGLRALGADTLSACVGDFVALAVTLPPDPHIALLYLDGAPLLPYRPLTPAQAARVMLFSTKRAATVSIGLTPLGGTPPQKKLRIRCINRQIGRILPIGNT